MREFTIAAGEPLRDLRPHLFGPPLFCRKIPITVKPDQVGPECRDHLLDLTALKSKEPAPSAADPCSIVFQFGEERIIRMRPVQMGKIEANLEPLFPERITIGLSDPLPAGVFLTTFRSLCWCSTGPRRRGACWSIPRSGHRSP